MARHNSILVSRTLYQLGVVTFVAAIVWTASGIYSATSKPEKSTAIDKAILEPINPSIDESVLKEMISRLKVDNSQLEVASPSASETENVTIEAGELR